MRQLVEFKNRNKNTFAYPHAVKSDSSYVGVIPIDIMSATNAERKTEENIEHLKVSQLKSGWWEGGGNNKKLDDPTTTPDKTIPSSFNPLLSTRNSQNVTYP